MPLQFATNQHVGQLCQQARGSESPTLRSALDSQMGERGRAST
jgi:hypothetical protein